jgi:hypothetical protein
MIRFFSIDGEIERKIRILQIPDYSIARAVTKLGRDPCKYL